MKKIITKIGGFMKKFDLNSIPELLKNHQITDSQAVDFLAIFLQNNGYIFNLENETKDLKSEVVLTILERGKSFLENFDSSSGSFFNYFYTFIKSTIRTIKRKDQNKIIKDFYNISEGIINFPVKQKKYSEINYNNLHSNQIPYRYKAPDPKDFQIACESDKYTIKKYINNSKENSITLNTKLQTFSPLKIKKIILVLTLKSAWYIQDDDIKKVSEVCGIEYDILLSVIQSLKEDLNNRFEHRKDLELRRNKAYFHHKKYYNLINYLKDEEDSNTKGHLEILQRKYIRHTNSWINLNKDFRRGRINIRPTNKTVADILGICERQVSYYIKNVEELNCIN